MIDPEGVVQHSSVNNTGVARSLDETLRLVQAFQSYRENGEVRSHVPPCCSLVLLQLWCCWALFVDG